MSRAMTVASGLLITQYEYLSAYRQYHRTLALIDVDRLHFVQVQLFRYRQRPCRTLHLKRSVRPAPAANPTAHRVTLAFKPHARKRDEPKPLLSTLIRLLVLLVVRRTHVLQPHRMAKVHGEQGPLARQRLGRVLVLVRLVRHADHFERHAHVPHAHHRVVRVRICVWDVQGDGEVVLREHVLRHVRVWVVLGEKHHGAAEPRDRGQGWPPLSHEMGALWVPQLIAPWVWWIVHVHDGRGIFYLGKDDRVNLVSWAGNNDVVDNGLAERVNV